MPRDRKRRFRVPSNAVWAAYLLGAAEAVGARVWLPWLRSELTLPPGHPAQDYVVDHQRWETEGRVAAHRLGGGTRSRKSVVVREIERKFKCSRRRRAWPEPPLSVLAELWAPNPVVRTIVRTRIGATRAGGPVDNSRVHVWSRAVSNLPMRRVKVLVAVGESIHQLAGLRRNDAVDYMHWFMPGCDGGAPERAPPAHFAVGIAAAANAVMRSPAALAMFATWNAEVSPTEDPLRFLRGYLEDT